MDWDLFSSEWAILKIIQQYFFSEQRLRLQPATIRRVYRFVAWKCSRVEFEIRVAIPSCRPHSLVSLTGVREHMK